MTRRKQQLPGAWRFLMGISMALLVLCFALPAVARPGGGHAFRSSTSTSSSSGSNSSSSSSTRSSSGSSWSWGSTKSGSSDSSGSLFGSGTASSPSTPSHESSSVYTQERTEQLQRSLDDGRCFQSCMHFLSSGEADRQSRHAKCHKECMSETERRRSASSLSRPTHVTRSPPAETPLSSYFLWPGLLLGLVSFGAGTRYVLAKREEQRWASILAEPVVVFHQSPGPQTSEQAGLPAPAAKHYPSVQAAIAALRARDKAFSWVLFEDFLYALYAEAHRLRGSGGLDLLAPYLAPKALSALSRLPKKPVAGIVVGALAIERVTVDESQRRIIVRANFEANYAEGRGDDEVGFYTREVWQLSRSADLSSRPRDKARVIGCPGCGAPLEKAVGGKCDFCGEAAAPGSHDWRVDGIAILDRELGGPMLTGTVEERGTNLPTVVAPDAPQELQALSERDPEFSWAAFVARVDLVFHTFHRAWSAQELRPMRPYLSDALFDTQRYWVLTYQAQKLRNVTESPELVTVHLSRISSDTHFDAVTVRVFAQCIDYTVDESGRVVGGSKSGARQYTEYWTFIRGRGAQGAPRADAVCPSCGAPLTDVKMAGECGHCHVEVTNGQFDWVLSRIEQDESYAV